MDFDLKSELQKIIKGEVSSEADVLSAYSHDASIFELKPEVVVSPQDVNDVCTLVKFVSSNKKTNPHLSITARSAGSDMSGGALSESIVLSMTPHMNKISGINGTIGKVEPGAFYRDFEKLAASQNLVFPAYPVSRAFCAIGGMIGNNCGGEKSLEYGKADRYVEKLKVVLGDGNVYEIGKLSEDQLKEKLNLQNFEGDLYRKIFKLITDNYELIQEAKPKVSKNSAGYALWDVYNKDQKTFDLTKLFVGSQGTLGVIVEADLRLVPIRKHSRLLVLYLYNKDLGRLGDIINSVLETKPESFETYDDHTFRLALKYFPDFSVKLGTKNKLATFLRFLPDFITRFTGRFPKLILQVEFTGDDMGRLIDHANNLRDKLKAYNILVKDVGNGEASKKYWLIRRDSFKLLKEKIKDKYASPFIDDFVVNPEHLTEFLPRFNKIISKYPSIISTVAGHIGDGNFHIIPLVNLRSEEDRKIITKLSKEVFDLVHEYQGTTSGEHNDGIIRTPYLKDMFGEKVYKLFLDTKNIFDPTNIFNPGKKTDITLDYLETHIRTEW